ncbi:MAG: PaaI family thioesterase [Pseudomonadota bacterium]
MLGDVEMFDQRVRMEIDETLPWREIRSQGFNGHIGPMRIARASETTWQAALLLDARHINFGGVCHGGVYMSFADVAMGAAASETLGRKPCATIDFNAHFMAAAKEGHTLIAHTALNRMVSGICFMECELWAGGRKCMRASGIWKQLSDRPGPTG